MTVKKVISIARMPAPVWQDPRKVDGELLSPDRFGEKEVKNYKKLLGSYGYAGQYQQRPSPLSGGLFQKSWFPIWKKKNPPKMLKIIQSWDTAFKEKEASDWSVCSTWGVFSSSELNILHGDATNLYSINFAILISIWRGRVGYPELRSRALRLAENYTDIGDDEEGKKYSNKPDLILMEDKASGQSLIQDLHVSGIKNIIGRNPSKYGDKVSRAHYVSPLVENNLVYLASASKNSTDLRPSASLFLSEALVFPKSKNDDIVDTFSQFLIYAKETRLLKIPTDPVWEDIEQIDNSGIRFF